MNRYRCGYDTVFLSEYIRILSKIRTQCIITYYVHNRFSISYMFLNWQATHQAAYFLGLCSGDTMLQSPREVGYSHTFI